jgi:hypothetical protein
MWFREEVGVYQSQEVREAVLVAVMGCCSQQKDVLIGPRGQLLRELVALGLFYLR